MEIFTQIEIRGTEAAVDELVAVVHILKDFGPELMERESEVASRLPRHFAEKFSKEMSEADKVAWLHRWRAASSGEKARLEEERGWELGQWLYWFSPKNEYWRVVDVVKSADPLSCSILLECDDEQFPREALEWLAACVGGELIDIRPA
ncbi:hypothetical protein [Streptomyces sp. NPDC059874]|uniref:hypothetical protein n=1 Tax=Streptomyces sp. NPDC059874 TaxID=3346983 RepID=UPI00364CBA9B